jgi:hypothetical protein
VDPTAKGWMKISGIYVATVDHREMVRIGVRNAPGAMVWFDDVSVRIRDEGPRALRLTMLGAPGTEVISSEGEGLRPFPQPLLIARRKGKATVFASVMEPYRGRRIVRSVRPLAPDPHDGGAGVVVETDDTIDRVAVSTTSGVESFPDLILEGAVGAVSVSLKTGALRCLCLGEGTRIAHGSWSLEAAQPTTLYLEGTDGSYLLRSWGEDSVQITLRAPDIDRDWAVVEGEGEGGVGERVDADLSDGRASFVARGGTSYRLGRTANRGDR